MRHAIALLIGILLMSPGADAQSYTTGWAFHGMGNNSTPAPDLWLGTIDPQGGSLTTILTSVNVQLSTQSSGAVMDTDNRTYVVSVMSKMMNGSLLHIDQAGAIIKTTQIYSTSPPQSLFLYDVAVDGNGDYIVLVGPGGVSGAGILKVDRNTSAVTTLVNGAPLTSPMGLLIDVETGDFIVSDNDFNNRMLYRIKPDGSSVQSIAALPVQITNQVTQLVGNGDFYIAAANFSPSQPGANLLRVNAGGTVTTVVGRTLAVVYGVAADRSSAASPRLAMASGSTSSGIYYFSGTSTVTTILKGSNYTFRTIIPDRGRNVATEKFGPGKWTVRFSFPGEAGNGWACGLTASSTRPGVPLADGRTVYVNLDDLLRLSVGGFLTRYFKGHTGILDPFDEGTGTIDVSSIPGVSGVRIWIQALTLNSQAPLGIQTIAEPVLLIL